MSQSPVYIGVDVSSDSLAVHGPDLDPVYLNTPEGVAKLIKAFPKGAHLVLEATGGYEMPLVLAFHERRLAVSVVNGRHVRDFAKAMGRLAKTDKVDAATIAQFAVAKGLVPDPVPCAAQLRLAELVARRLQLVELRLAESNRLIHLYQADLRADLKRHLAFLDRAIAKIERLVAEAIAADLDLNTKCKRLREVQGVGLITAATLLALMPELGSLCRARAASLAGVAPFARDSGQFKGKRCIWGGRAAVRRVLYMATLTAIVRNRIFRAFYLRLRKAGKPAKLALTAVMRKLISLLNHMLKNPNFSLAT
jgi:transposase